MLEAPERMDQMAKQPTPNLPTVRVKPNSYQPSKAEMEEPIRLPAGTTPLRLAKAVVTPVRIIKDPK